MTTTDKLKPIFPQVSTLLETGEIEFQFRPSHGPKTSAAGANQLFRGREALDKAAGVALHDDLYRLLLDEAQALVEGLPIENDPRNDWLTFHSKCLELKAAAERLEIKNELVKFLDQEASEAYAFAHSMTPVPAEKPRRPGRPRKMFAALEIFISNVFEIYREAGGDGRGSWPSKSASGLTTHRGGVQDLICVVLDALRDYGCPVILDGDTDPSFTDRREHGLPVTGEGDLSPAPVDAIDPPFDSKPPHTLSRSLIHQFLMKIPTS